MKRYNPSEIEPKWQQVWEDQKTYKAHDDSKKPPYYALSMFPYPSGLGLHIGHVRNFTITDVAARFKRMLGHEVMQPMGWDSFGLPAENYAIKTGTPPHVITKQNTDNFRTQAKHLGLSIDWDRELGSTDPDYYKWTQWFFLLLHKKGLAYQKESAQFWCTACKTVLANEQVVNGCCWRHEDLPVTKKFLKQWFFKITDYADRLEADLEGLDWPDKIKAMQRNWIGRSKGAELDFAIDGISEIIKVFTTRADTLFGATFLVLAPEHPLAKKIASPDKLRDVEMYVKQAETLTDVDRMDEKRRKTGVFTGAYAINPINGEKLPIWVADYVLGGYGTGAIMAVPAHDERDHAFATHFNLPIVEVVEPETGEQRDNEELRKSIVAIVYDPRTKRYLSLFWKMHKDNLFVGGGIENDENIIDAAKREIAEETGYTDVNFVAQTGKMHHHYYSHSKNVARFIEAHGLLFELNSDAHQEPALEAHEKDMFSAQWLAPTEIEQKIHDDLHLAAFKQLVKGERYHGEGILANSGKYNGMASSDVREQIVADLGENGQERVNYKIRDWLISRQRYWGAPIPMVHCYACAVKEASNATTLNFYHDDIWNALKNGRKTVESRALNPDESERLFADIKDVFKGVNKNSSEEIAFKVLETRTYKNLKDFYADTEFAKAVTTDGVLPSFEEFEKMYNFTPDYVEKINTHGLIAWRVNPIKEVVPVPAEQLPIELPPLDDFAPSGDGRSPLAKVRDWVETDCPKCGGPAERETDTMDGFACSSWYFLRFADPHNDKEPFSKELAEKWLPVDAYVGGAEHAVMHLLYARMWTKVMFEEGMISFDEPFKALRNQGMLLAADGSKFSKSKGNGVDPEDVINSGYGADALRTVILFLAPFDQSTPWSPEGLGGVYRFLNRIWTLAQEVEESGAQGTADDAPLKRAVHKTIKKVTSDMRDMGYNTAIAAQMELVNELYKLRATVPINQAGDTWRWAIKVMAQLVAPCAPHMAEELWAQFGGEGSVHLSDWPSYDDTILIEKTVTIVVQVNGKVRAKLQMPADAPQLLVEQSALADMHTRQFITGEPKKIIYVPGKVLNIVV